MTTLYRWYEPLASVMAADCLEHKQNYLGGKGAGLFDMIEMGAPVPEFVVIPTSVCQKYQNGSSEAKMDIKSLAKEIIDTFVEKFGHLPLLSVRSGARVSMPGMMDTILNVGMLDELCDPYVSKLQPRTFYDCQRRFLHMYGSTVCGVPDSKFEQLMAEARSEFQCAVDADFDAAQLMEISDRFRSLLDVYEAKVPDTAREQLENCIIAVMDSWNSDRAKEYRKHNDIPDNWGTAVVVQRMVLGNMNDNSGSGVLFTRCPSTGVEEIMAEYLPNAQGEDVVAGIRTPDRLELPSPGHSITWRDALFHICGQLEAKYTDMLDIEFTVEDGQLYLLQVRRAKRSARAWIRSTLDMASAGTNGWVLDEEEVRQRIRREHVKMLTQPVVSPDFKGVPDFDGLPACAGVVTGVAVFTSDQALQAKEPCVLIRHETSPDDIAGMYASVAVVTATGGATSHAAVVARGMDKVCVVGCTGLKVDGCKYHAEWDDGAGVVSVGDKVTVDGTTGRVYVNQDVPVSDPSSDKDLTDLTVYVDKVCGVSRTPLDVALPGSSGSVYMLDQFRCQELPQPPAGPLVTVLGLTQVGSEDDILLNCAGPLGVYEAVESVKVWAEKHKLIVGVYCDIKETVSFGGGEWAVEILPLYGDESDKLGALLHRPIVESELGIVLGASIDSLRALIAPVKLEDKFAIAGCQRYRLMAYFN